MAQEIVEAIRKAEIEAEQIEKKALAESTGIRKQSHKETELIVADMINNEMHQAETALEEARMLGRQWMKEAEAAAEIEIGQLRETAKHKEDQIVSLIVADLI